MNITKQTLDLSPRPKLRLSEIERLIRVNRIIIPPPSRRALIAMCEEGTLKGPAHKRGEPYLVFEDSFLEWIRAMDEDA